MPNITLYDAITNLSAGTPPGIGTPSGTGLAYGQIPSPSLDPLVLPAMGAFTPNTTGVNTATISPTSPSEGYAGYTNYNPTSLLPGQTAAILPPFTAATLDSTAGYTISFNAAIPTETSNPNRAGFSITAISSDGLNGLELGFKNGTIFGQSATFTEPTTLGPENANFNTSANNNYVLKVQGTTYELFANNFPSAILTGPLRQIQFDPALSQPPLSFNPYRLPSFLFFGDNTDQGSATFRLGRIAVNDLPVASPDNAITTVGTKVKIKVLSNDTGGPRQE